MKPIGLSLAVFLFGLNMHHSRAEGNARTLQSFGVTVQYGQPVYPLPSNVTLGLFNPDPLLDVAFYADGKVQVWQNLGNGTFGNEPVFEKRVSGEVVKMEWRKSRMLDAINYDPRSWGDLQLQYTGGRTELIVHEQMMSKYFDFSSLPQTASTPPLSFHEVWRSAPNYQGFDKVAVGDIDNDGRIEIAYMFGPPQYPGPSRLVVYENVGNDNYVVEWDSAFGATDGPYGITDVDNDGHKEWMVLFRGGVGLVECYGSGVYRIYSSNNIGVVNGYTFKMLETDIDHDGIKEITMLRSDPSIIGYQTFVQIGEFAGKGICPSCPWGYAMTFDVELARIPYYTIDMTIGQVDGVGRDEIVPGNGGFGVGEPTPIDYFWYSGTPGPFAWQRREIYTGLQSGSHAPMFVNLDSDTTKELVIGGVGPIGHGSMFALKYLHDTTWSVLWADSSLRNSPLWVNAGMLAGQSVVAGANTRENPDSSYTQLHVYKLGGQKLGYWQRDSLSIQQFHFANADGDNYSDLIFAQVSDRVPHCLKVFETDTPTGILETGQQPKHFSLEQNYPNPFNPTTKIRYRISEASRVALKVYDVLGREVRTLMNENLQAGSYEATFDATGLGSGVYCYQLRAGEFTSTRKLLLLR